jgi:hypothetical protein
MTEQVHVIPHNDNWAVRVANRERVESTHTTKDAAIAAGRTLAESLKAELKLHNLSGTISESNSHGNDPRNIPG